MSLGKNSESYCKHAICASTKHFILLDKNSEWNYLLQVLSCVDGRVFVFIKIPLWKILLAVSFTTKIILFVKMKCTLFSIVLELRNVPIYR